MPRYFIKLSYNGDGYHGWQIQDNAVSIQGEIIDKISMLLNEKVDIVGCGRTDTGVHASEYFAHFETDQSFDSDNLKYKLNKVLSENIAIHKVFLVGDLVHARFSASSRSYEYHIHTEKSAFKPGLSMYVPYALDVKKMNKAAQLLLGKKDFSCFSKSRTQTRTNNCDITKAEWITQGDNLVFHISADRFLRNMVRSIVGTLLDVGENRTSTEDILEIIESKDRRKAGRSVPAHGLYLSKVEYPDF